AAALGAARAGRANRLAPPGRRAGESPWTYQARATPPHASRGCHAAGVQGADGARPAIRLAYCEPTVRAGDRARTAAQSGSSRGRTENTGTDRGGGEEAESDRVPEEVPESTR